MFNICILDDQNTEAVHVKKIILPYFEQREMEIGRIDIFTDGISLLSSKQTWDMLFLDIEVGEENGIQIAKQLRMRLPDIIIIVVTSFVKYSIEGYKINAARYILKPVVPSLLYSELDEILEDYEEEACILGYIGDQEYYLKKKDIYYFESYGRKVQFHTAKEVYLNKENVSHWANRVDPTIFVECYKGIYVHARYIKHMGRETLTLDNNQKLPLARRRIEAVRKVWMAYQEKRI